MRYRGAVVAVLWFVFCEGGMLRADCTLTNTGLVPVNESGFTRYQGFDAGLYPAAANTRPPAHETAGRDLALNHVLPRDGAGNVETNNGRIVILSIGMSNTSQEWASKGTGNFRLLANADAAKNPRLIIVDGAQGGQASTDWTNSSAPTWNAIQNRLNTAGVTTNQVQILWMKHARRQPSASGAFPAHAQALQQDLRTILQVARSRYPNLKIAYLSSRTRAYRDDAGALNPEPFAYESAFSVKWLIEQQIKGDPGLNYDPAMGPVMAPWLAWGPYLWADGTTPRSDGFTWLCSDLENDFTHPSASGGVPKVGQQLWAFFKTDPTATPWFLKVDATGQPPSCTATANVTSGAAPLTVNFSADAADPDGSIIQYVWTFDDGQFSFAQNPVKTFTAPGAYEARLTVTDNSGNTAIHSVLVSVNTTVEAWKAARFTAIELGNPAISGDDADPNGDGIPNLLAYKLGLEPKLANPPDSLPRASIADSQFEFVFSCLRAATDVELTVERTDDWTEWNPVPAEESRDAGPLQMLKVTVPLAGGGDGFFRLKATRL